MAMGMRTARRAFEYSMKKDEKDRLDKLLENNPNLFTPIEYQNALDEIESSGKFSIPKAPIIEGPATSYGEPPKPGPGVHVPKFGKDDQKSFQFVDPLLAESYPSLKKYSGQVLPKYVIDQIAKAERTNIIATGQSQRQDKTIEAGKAGKSQDLANKMVGKAYGALMSDPENEKLREELAVAMENAGVKEEVVSRYRAKDLAPEEESSILKNIGDFFNFNKSKAAPSSSVETENRRQNPQTKQWWVYRNGKWQPE